MSKGNSILVVDDDQALCELLRSILVKEGYRVTIAHTGEEALQKCRQGSFALALLDVMLPGMDGYTVCRRLREDPVTHHIPILMLTANGGIADKIAGFEAGADDYLTKPFQPKELVYRAKSLMARVQATTSNEGLKVDRGTVIAVFGSKGGVGKTTIATNLVVSLRQQTNKRVALVDADFYFGDVGVHLNLPSVRTVLDMIKNVSEGDPSIIDQALVPHASGVRVLLSPFGPEEGEQVSVADIETILAFLVGHYDFIVVDCQPSYDERVLKVLELAEEILIVVTPEIGPLKNTSLFLDWAARQGYSLDRINVALNRYNSNVGIGADEIERTLQHEVAFRIISGGRPVVLSVNRGIPLVIEQPDHPFSMQIQRIAEFYAGRSYHNQSVPVVSHRRGL